MTLHPTDADLMAASVTDPAAFATIFDRHADAVHRFLGRRVGDLADDLLSETFLVAFRRRAEHRPDALDVRPWLYGIAANLVRHHHRAEATRYRLAARAAGRIEPAVDGADDRVAATVDAHRMAPALAAALAGLSPGDREVLLLTAWEQLTYAEVAAALDIPVGTVRSRLHRARRLVREHLAAHTTLTFDLTEDLR